MPQLIPIPLIGPGFLGLNKQLASSTNLGPEWALEAQNCVFDDTNRLAARKGWTNQSSTPIAGSPNISQIFEHIKADGTTNVISAANNDLFLGIVAPTTIKGAVAITANNWQFVNFIDNAYGLQSAHALIQYTGAGNAAAVVAVSGTVPTGNCLLAAFGRLWATQADGFTIKYCGLVDPTNWGAAGSGSIDMRKVWTHGNDTIIGLAAFGANLIVFGSRQIIMWVDGQGSQLGLDPATMYVVDTIEGTGLLARDSVRAIGQADLWFLSSYGLQSLSRVVTQKTNPLSTVSRNVQTYANSFVVGETPAAIRSVYSAKEDFYLLILPASARVFCFSTKQMLDDGSARCTEWLSMAPQSAVLRANKDLLFGFNGRVGLHSGYTDNTVSYTLTYTSPNLVGDPQLQNRKKIGKKLGSVVFVNGPATMSHKYGYDFKGLQYSRNVSIKGGAIPEYATAEWGTNGKYNVNDPAAVAGVNYSEWGGSAALKILETNINGDGRWFQVGITVPINGYQFAIQQLDFFGKAGRAT